MKLKFLRARPGPRLQRPLRKKAEVFEKILWLLSFPSTPPDGNELCFQDQPKRDAPPLAPAPAQPRPVTCTTKITSQSPRAITIVPALLQRNDAPVHHVSARAQYPCGRSVVAQQNYLPAANRLTCTRFPGCRITERHLDPARGSSPRASTLPFTPSAPPQIGAPFSAQDLFLEARRLGQFFFFPAAGRSSTSIGATGGLPTRPLS